MVPAFRNEPFTDFTDHSNARAFEAALSEVEGAVRDWPLVIGGQPAEGKRVIRRIALRHEQPEHLVLA